MISQMILRTSYTNGSSLVLSSYSLSICSTLRSFRVSVSPYLTTFQTTPTTSICTPTLHQPGSLLSVSLKFRILSSLIRGSSLPLQSFWLGSKFLIGWNCLNRHRSTSDWSVRLLLISVTSWSSWLPPCSCSVTLCTCYNWTSMMEETL